MVPLLFGCVAALLVLGVPIVASLGLSSLVTVLAAGINPIVAIQKFFAGVDSAALLAIPFFILAGDLMNKGGLAKRLINFAGLLVGRVSGGMGLVAIISCMLFAAISGSGIATAAAIGGVMVSGLVARGYSPAFGSAIVAAASPIGIIIPPSIAFIIYGVLSKASVSDLYKAGIPAGLIVGAALMLTTYVIARRRGYGADRRVVDDQATTPRPVGAKVSDALWALGTPVIIVGGVFLGVFTPTESAVVAVVYSIVVGIFVFKEMKFSDLPGIFLQSAISTAAIMIIIAAASLFAWVMVYLQIPQKALAAMLGLSDSKIVILLIVNLILLIAGSFMEASSIQVIAVPILLPIMKNIGIDPVHFGIFLTVNLAIGMLTPPFGLCLFTSARVFKANLKDAIGETWPFLFVLIAALLLITFVPQLVMFPV